MSAVVSGGGEGGGGVGVHIKTIKKVNKRMLSI
jgi:hypothetical protein